MFDEEGVMAEEPEGGELPVTELARQMTSGAVRLAAATAAWLALIAEFDRRKGWGGVGIRSCAHWLAWQCGLSPGVAREHVRVTRALNALPATAAAFAAGRLSYAKVRALTRVAEPHTEAELLALAHELTASQLERVVREWRRADAVDAATVAATRRFEHHWDEAGMLHVRLCLDAEQGAAFLAGVDSLAERTARRERAAAKKSAAPSDGAGCDGAGCDGAGCDGAECDGAGCDGAGCDGAGCDGVEPDGASPGDVEQVEQDEVARARDRSTARRCAAVAQLAAAAADADRRAGDPPRREVVIHVDAAVLADDAAAGRAHLAGGPALHPSDVRRMLCEATVVTMLERGREPLAVGRARRLATRAQRRALHRRDGGCARLGCAETRIERLHAHHLRPWLSGGGTDVANTVLLCDVDHGLAHDLDLTMARRDGQLVVTTPDGRRVWGAADAAFRDGVAGLSARDTDAAFAGVPPLDTAVARRPAATETLRAERDPAAAAPALADDPAATTPTASITRLLFPDRTPDLPEAVPVDGEAMDLAYVVGVLLGNRDLERRLAAENAGNAGRLTAAA
ncbi:HNH endonuclease [Geodermatophilus sp. TF02-6]|uniref:HNH endonuclease signature motif containing protein n=1 Tax=Geodermatophilus sp. TF02-6 TaxID=2250575 RepID=UPI000DEAC061|nr:HNH endonuclease signature motif containing protein [Geodermatophilus sp. TF02-6]RBY80595.1 HNH endonuclease [Geodermatophilus sp. TF02-6]